MARSSASPSSVVSEFGVDPRPPASSPLLRRLRWTCRSGLGVFGKGLALGECVQLEAEGWDVRIDDVESPGWWRYVERPRYIRLVPALLLVLVVLLLGASDLLCRPRIDTSP